LIKIGSQTEIYGVNIQNEQENIQINNPSNEIKSTEKKINKYFNFKNIKTIGLLTIISAAINSLLEGLIIGIVFSTRNKIFIIPTVVAVALGLIPKRVGDAGLLLFANFDMWAVIFWNTIANFLILLGTGIGLLVGGIDRPGHYYTLSFVAGGFLYMSLSEMVPIKVVATGLLNIILQFVFLILGLGTMYIIAVVELQDEKI
jgi:zinc transporter ZupT